MTPHNDLFVTEIIFRHVKNKGRYSVGELYELLRNQYQDRRISQESIDDALRTLASVSDLYEYHEAHQLLVVNSTYMPLNPMSIESLLPDSISEEIAINHCFVTLSTNSDLEKLNLQNRNVKAAIAIAEMQSGGRGRRAKRWVSPLAKNLYFSFKYHFPQSALPYLSSLSLRAGMALLTALQSLGISKSQLKWPNDIWVGGQKLAGILVESTITQSGVDVIIGIGVNNQYDRSLEVVGNHPTCCERVLGQPIDRNQLVAMLSTHLYQLCHTIEYQPSLLPDLMECWPAYSCFYGKTVRLVSDSEEIVGEEVGVDKSGALLIKLVTGEVKSLYAGDLSLRAF